MARWMEVFGRGSRREIQPSAAAEDPTSRGADDALQLRDENGRAPRLGIGVTTFNRRAMLERTLTAIADRTLTPHALFVADDGSSDGTREMLARRRTPHLAAANRGIAWNKNRVLFYLHRIMRCDVMIVIEDDTFPTERGWERPWIDAVIRHGHVNLAPSHWGVDDLAGEGTAASPYQSDLVTGQCVGFSSEALDQVGYMDSRFRRYGYEHAEHTERLIRSGFGGVAGIGDAQERIFLISSALTVDGLDKQPDHAGVAHNAPIKLGMKDEPVFRSPWRDDEENAMFRVEMASVARSVAWDPGPDWTLVAHDSTPILFEPDSQNLHGIPATTASVAVGVRVRGGRALLFAGNDDVSARSWLRLIADGRVETVDVPEAATSFELVYAPGPGFGLRTTAGFLCCEMLPDRPVTCSRTELSEWETFHFGGYLPRHTETEPLASTGFPSNAP